MKDLIMSDAYKAVACLVPILSVQERLLDAFRCVEKPCLAGTAAVSGTRLGM